MNRISWGEAFRHAGIPALLVGPTLAALAALFFLFFTFVDLGEMTFSDSPILFAGLFFAMLYAAIIGLMIGTPICLLFGALGLFLASRHPPLRSHKSWALSGVFAGLLSGVVIPFVLFAENTLQEGSTWHAYTAALGALGGIMCRRLLQPNIFVFSTS